MLLGRILGNAVCTVKQIGLEGVKLLTVQPLDRHLGPVGTIQIAADVVYAGPGDLVVLVRSREAALAMRDEVFVPVDLACVGVVDELDVRDQGIDAVLQSGNTRYA